MTDSLVIYDYEYREYRGVCRKFVVTMYSSKSVDFFCVVSSLSRLASQLHHVAHKDRQ